MARIRPVHSALLVLWLLLLTVLSLAPLEFKIRLGTVGRFHNLGHFIAFAVTGALLSALAPGFRKRVVLYLAGLCFAIALEILEAVIYHNPTEWRDVLIDAAGLALGLVCTVFAARIRGSSAVN